MSVPSLPDVSTADKLKVWLAERPSETSIVFAARTALRVLPVAAEWATDTGEPILSAGGLWSRVLNALGNSQPRLQTPEEKLGIVVCIFRACAIALCAAARPGDVIGTASEAATAVDRAANAIRSHGNVYAAEATRVANAYLAAPSWQLVVHPAAYDVGAATAYLAEAAARAGFAAVEAADRTGHNVIGIHRDVRAAASAAAIAATYVGGGVRDAFDPKDRLIKYELLKRLGKLPSEVSRSAVDIGYADIAFLAAIGNAASLISEPLWLETALKNPRGWPDTARSDHVANEIVRRWQRARDALLQLDMGFDLWTTWYDDRLTGKPLNNGLETQLALASGDIWKKGVKAINAYIAQPASGR